MAASDFLAFATGGGANVESQATYAADATTGSGFATGVASSQKCNKVWRQASFVAAGVARFMLDALGINIADDGDLPTFTANLNAAILAAVDATAPAISSLGVNGYYRHPGGLLENWGYYAGGASEVTIVYPHGFTTLYNVQVTAIGVDPIASSANVAIPESGPGVGSFDTFCYNESSGVLSPSSSVAFYWRAIGQY